jgi:hypothetical protein
VHIVVIYPERIESEANGREHWSKKAGRAKRHRIRAWAELRGVTFGNVLGPVHIKLTRIAPRLMDGDNLQSGFKATRDGVADWLGVDDGDRRLTWLYAQERGAPKFYGIKIEVKTEEA